MNEHVEMLADCCLEKKKKKNKTKNVGPKINSQRLPFMAH